MWLSDTQPHVKPKLGLILLVGGDIFNQLTNFGKCGISKGMFGVPVIQEVKTVNSTICMACLLAFHLQHVHQMALPLSCISLQVEFLEP